MSATTYAEPSDSAQPSLSSAAPIETLGERAQRVDLGLSHLDARYDKDAPVMFGRGHFRGDARDKFAFNSLVRIHDEIKELGLERNVLELELFGYTIVEPDKVAPPVFQERMRQAVLGVAKRKTGLNVTAERGFEDRAAIDGAGAFEDDGAVNQLGWMLAHRVLFEDQTFEEAVMNRTALALSSYLMGYHFVLGTTLIWLKQGPTPDEVTQAWDGGMHVDSWLPEPFPPYIQQVNCTWALSDYTKDNGGLLFVPGSHKLQRRPDHTLQEGRSELVPVECPAGSLILFGDSVWHGIYPRKNPGIRLTFGAVYKRSYLQTEEAYRHKASTEMFARNPARFRTLMGDDLDYNVDSDRGGNPALGMAAMRRY